MADTPVRIKVGAVSYLNTVPLVWGMLHGDEQRAVDLSFSLPAICAEQVANGVVDVGLVPVAEIARQGLTIVSDLGIAAVGPVRSILLVSQVPLKKIRTLAVDSSSRTSVQLAKVILRERYGVSPSLTPQAPVLREMLSWSDAALIIGDPALLIDPEQLTFESLDLGAEWTALTSLPMVFAAWAGKPDFATRNFPAIARASYSLGQQALNHIAETEANARGISPSLARTYLSHHIHFELGTEELRGLEAFYELAGLVPASSFTI